MNPNKRLLEFSGDKFEKLLNYYAYATKDTKRPTTIKSVDLFWDTFGKRIHDNTFDVTESYLLNASQFYKELQNNQSTINEKIDFINFLNGYNAKHNIEFRYVEKAEEGSTESDKDTETPQLQTPEQSVQPEPVQSPAIEPENPVQPELPSKVEEAEKSNVSDLANGLTPEALEEVAKRIREMEYTERHTYNFKESCDANFTTKDIYNTDLYNNAMKKLLYSHRLVITALSGAGKTELAYLMAEDITGEKIGMNSSKLRRALAVSAGTGYSAVGDENKRVGSLDKFVEHIEKNNITEPCVLIFNELQKSDLRFLLGEDLFEQFNCPEQAADLPENLYLIFTHCKGAENELDNQITQRFPTVELEYVSANNNSISVAKLVNAFSEYDNADKIVSLASQINTIEENMIGTEFISTREIIKKLKSQETDLGINNKSEEYMHPDSRKLLKELREL